MGPEGVGCVGIKGAGKWIGEEGRRRGRKRCERDRRVHSAQRLRGAVSP